MAIEASTLSIRVQSEGIASATEALNKLAQAGDKAEKSAAKLSDSNKGQEASAKKQQALWYDLIDKASKYYERQWNIQQKALQRQNEAAEAAILREANSMNKAFDKVLAAIKGQNEKIDTLNYQARSRAEAAAKAQVEALDVIRYKERSNAEKQLKAQNEALDILRNKERNDAVAALKKQQEELDTLRYKARMKAEADAAASAERMAINNARFSTASSGSRLSTVRQAAAYGANGGDIAAMYGSEVAAHANASGIQRLTDEHKRLQEEARKSRQALNEHTNAMGDAHAMARGLTGSLGALWLTYGNVLPLIAGAAIGASMKEAVSGFMEVQYQMTFMKALTEDTTNSVSHLTEEMHKVAGELGISPDAAAKGLRALAQAGLDTNAALKTLPAAFKLATVGELPLEQAALAGISVLNAYGVAAEKQADGFEHVGDVMAKAGAMSAASVASMTESFKYSAGTAEQYGVSLEKLATVMTMLGKRSITGSSAGVAANNLIAEVYSPSSQKAIQAQAALGVKAYANGVRKSLEDVIQEIKQGLTKYDAESQGILLEAMFGKKGGKAFYAVAQSTKEAFMSMEQELIDSTGFTANVYKQSLETLKGQADLTKSAITNMFAKIGEESDAPLKSILQTIRQFANSDAAKDAFIGLAQSIKTFLEVATPVAAVLGGVWASMKVGTLAMALFSKATLEVIALNAGKWFYGTLSAVASLTQGITTMNLAMVATNPIFLAIAGAAAILGGAYLILRRNKQTALDLHEQEMKNAKEAQDSFEKDIELLEKKLELQKRGVAAADMDSEIRKGEAKDVMSKLLEEKMKNQELLDKKIKEPKLQGVYGDAARAEVVALQNKNKAYQKAMDEQQAIVNREEKLQTRMRQVRESARLVQVGQDLASEGQGTGPLQEGSLKFDPKAGKAAQKVINFAQQEILELNKGTAAYKAKSDAMLEAYANGQKVAAMTQQMIVQENLKAGKYGGNMELYAKAMSAAKANDAAKDENERMKKFSEFTDHLQQAIDGEKAFQEASEAEGNAFFGQQRRKAEHLIKYLNLSDQVAERLRNQADLVDKIAKAEDARAKIRSATANAEVRTGEAEAEIESMQLYGTRTKATALEVAKLAIEKAKLNSGADEGIKNALLTAAANEQASESYRDLLKNQLDIDTELEKAQADSLTLFGQSEMEKVRIVADRQRKIAELEMAHAQAAFDQKAMDGTATFADVVRINQAQAAYKKTLDTIDKISKVRFGNILAKNEVDQWKNLGKTIEDSLTKAFGRAGEAAGKMFNLFAEGQARDLAVTNQIGALKEAQSKDGIDRTKEIGGLQKEAAQSRLGEYAGMADAAKGFFDENSRGYEAMTKAANVLRMAEVALSVVKGVNAVLTQGSGDPYSAFARMAAMAAIVAGLGVALSGSVGGGFSAKQQQEVQGTGSVLGSRTSIVNGRVELVGEKSESIKNSLSILEKNSGLGLVQDNAMLRSMQSLSNSISSLAARVASNSGVTGDYKGNLNTNNGFATSLATGGGLLLGGLLGAALTKMPIVGKISTSIFGGKQSVDDTGFTLGKDSLAQVLANGVKAQQYANITTSGGWFRGDKHKTEMTPVDKASADQFTGIIKQMSEALTEAAKVFGVSGDDFTKHLQSFVVDIGNISLKGMKGDEIEKALGNIFSKLGDDMAMFAFSNLQQYQKVGEGMLETVGRLANDFLQVNDVFTVMGKTLPKTIESLADVEKLIKEFGSIDGLTSKVGSYINAIYSEDQKLDYLKQNVQSAMKELNLLGVTTKAQFKDVVDAAFANKDYELYSKLLNVADAFGQVADAADKAKESSVSEARSALTEAYNREADAIKATQDRMTSFVKTLKDLQKSTLLSDLSPLTPQQKYLEAKSQFEQVAMTAKSGDEEAQGKYQGAYQAFLEASQLVNASGAQYQKDFEYAQKATQEAMAWTQRQVDVAKASLDALNLQVAGLITINNSVLSVTDAINNLIKLQGGDAGQVASKNATNAIESLYQNLLGRHSDEAGMQFWLDTMKRGNTIEDIAKLIGNSPEARGEVKYVAPNAVSPVTAIQSGSMSNSSNDVAAAFTQMKAMLEEVKSTIAEGSQNTVGAIYDSQDNAAEKTVDGISEALQSSNKAGMYKLVER